MRALTIFFLSALAFLIGGCASSPATTRFDSVQHLRDQYVERLDATQATELIVPFELDAQVQGAAAEVLSPSIDDRFQIRQINSFIFRRLGLVYDLYPTRTASQTVEDRRGNCLSFVNLFVGIARHYQLDPFYVEVADYQKWNHREGLVVSRGHIVAGIYVSGKLETYDFLPYRPKSYKDFEPIDDLTATAHYYNNLGAEALMEGDPDDALGYFETAVALAPDFDKGINNLGVGLSRIGRLEEADEVFTRGLELDPKNVPLLANRARLYQQTGRLEEAEKILLQLDSLQNTNPFYYIYRGQLALGQGDSEAALEYMRQALRQDSGIPEVHIGLAEVFLAAGDLERARHHVERALKLDATHTDARRLAAMLTKRGSSS